MGDTEGTGLAAATLPSAIGTVAFERSADAAPGSVAAGGAGVDGLVAATLPWAAGDVPDPGKAGAGLPSATDAPPPSVDVATDGAGAGSTTLALATLLSGGDRPGRLAMAGTGVTGAVTGGDGEGGVGRA